MYYTTIKTQKVQPKAYPNISKVYFEGGHPVTGKHYYSSMSKAIKDLKKKK